ncbi:MAG: ferrous iron transport protein B, partial [Clostridiales bacterium]|nr:ferrous iron transport protein B [Clostridiales bacterium]
MSNTIRIALVGNPNSGKTTLFNALTGSNQYVGNWPGVTVEKKEGKIKKYNKNLDVKLVDLPGIYSFSPYTMEEIVTRNFILEENPDAVINIVDATNIERNLYLSIQLLEMEKPTVIALNMMDEVTARGDKIDVDKLSELLGIPVIPITARTGENLDRLMDAVYSQIDKGFVLEPDDLYDEYTHKLHHEMDDIIGDSARKRGLPVHWTSIKLLEGDSLVKESLDMSPEQASKAEEISERYEKASEYGDRETIIADRRYKYIEKVVGQAVKKGKKASEVTVTEKIDKVLTNKYFAIPIFLFIMFILFLLTFSTLGGWLKSLMEWLLNDNLSPFVSGLLTSAGVAEWVKDLVINGIFTGVSGVLTFLPQIAVLFFCLSILEDSGYMARVAFIMDRLLKRFGLSGKAFIPMLMGFGCSVPAIMAARTMENQKDRRMTILLIPFMSCSAKLPIYGLITAAFFPGNAGFAMFGLYLMGIVVGILSGILFKKTIFKGDDAPFVMELPPYRMPTLKGTAMHVWDKVEHFLQKAGTLILAMSVVLWFLTSFSITFTMVSN